MVTRNFLCSGHTQSALIPNQEGDCNRLLPRDRKYWVTRLKLIMVMSLLSPLHRILECKFYGEAAPPVAWYYLGTTKDEKL